MTKFEEAMLHLRSMVGLAQTPRDLWEHEDFKSLVEARDFIKNHDNHEDDEENDESEGSEKNTGAFSPSSR